MKQRWLPVAALAGGLFLFNIVVRLVVRLAAGKDEGTLTWIGVVALGAVALVVLLAGVWWTPKYPMPRTIGDLALASVVGSLLAVLVGPLVSRGSPYQGGFGFIFAQFWYYLAFCAGGALFGILGVMSFGKDYKSQSWQRYIDAVQAKKAVKVSR